MMIWTMWLSRDQDIDESTRWLWTCFIHVPLRVKWEPATCAFHLQPHTPSQPTCRESSRHQKLHPKHSHSLGMWQYLVGVAKEGNFPKVTKWCEGRDTKETNKASLSHYTNLSKRLRGYWEGTVGLAHSVCCGAQFQWVQYSKGHPTKRVAAIGIQLT